MHKEKFMIYRRDAKKGEATYSPKSHSAPHFEGHYVEGMEEWASWYCFNKKDDGTYEAELDEAWNEGSHYGGGTINVDIPKEWFALSYVDFLEHVITLAAAKHYGFTVDDLKERKGLKQFFGFKDSINPDSLRSISSLSRKKCRRHSSMDLWHITKTIISGRYCLTRTSTSH